MKKIILLAGIFSAAFLGACDSGNKTTETEETDAVTETGEAAASGLSLSPIEEDTEFSEAMLEQSAPEDGAQLEPGAVTFEYNVKNFELTNMTETEHADMMAESHKGQHIHLILNNNPYDAVYETTYEKELDPGHYVELSFLSRSFHMSLKHPDAYVLRQFTVGDAQGEQADLNDPHMFYSRPKGTYTGPKETNKVMLDFYLVNTELSENGKQVRATINGENFMISKWQPYFIEGMPMGENTITLELLDEKGELVESPFNPVTRTITLKKGKQPAS